MTVQPRGGLLRAGRRRMRRPEREHDATARLRLIGQVASAPTLDAALELAVHGAVELLHADRVGLALFEAGPRQARLLAQFPPPPGQPMLYPTLPRATEKNPSLEWLQHREGLLIVPIIGGDRVVGSFGVESTTPGRSWQAQDLAFVEALAAQVYAALDRARLTSAVQAREDWLKQQSVALGDLIQIRDQMRLHLDPQRLLYEFALIVSRRLDHGRTLLLLVDDDGHSMQVAGAIGFESDALEGCGAERLNWASLAPLLQPAYRRGDAYLVPRAAVHVALPFGDGDVLILPLLSREDRIQGLLIVAAPPPRRLDDVIQLLEIFTSQVAVALENSRLYAGQHERANELAALYETAIALSSQLDLPSVLETIVERSVQLVGADNGGLYLLTPGATELELSVLYRLPPHYKGTRLKLGEGLAGRAAQTGRVQVTADYHDWEGRAEHYRDDGFHAVLAVPLFEEGQVVGVLDLLHETEGVQFQEQDIHVAKLFAAQAAVAVRNARLYGEQRHQTAQLQLINQVGQRLPASLRPDELMEQVVRLIRDAFGYYLVALGLVEHDALVFRTWAGQVSGLPPKGSRLSLREPSICAAAVASGRSVLVHDVTADERYRPVPGLELTRAELAIPLKTRGRVVGILDIESAEVGGIKPGDMQALETLADQIAVALENARLYDATSRQLERMAALARASTSLETSGNLRHALEPIAGEGLALLYANRCAVLLLDGTRAECAWSYGLSPDYLRLLEHDRAQLQEGRATGEGELIIEDIVPLLSGSRYAATVRAEGYRSLLSLPLLRERRPFGSVSFYYDQPNVWDGDRLEVARIVANQMAVAITNAQLYQSVELRNAELQQLNRVKTEFFANMSHELRTPMNSIIGYTDMLLEGSYGPMSGPAQDPLRRVKRNAVDLLAQINDLLDLSKIEAGHFVLDPQSFLFGELILAVDEAIEPLAQQKNLSWKVTVDEGVPRMMVADSVRLRQILVNLLGNAVKFTRDGGLELRCSVAPEAPLPAAVGPAMVYRVVDTGIGIPADKLEIIWESFRQVDGSSSREFGGTGLGLTIVRRLVELMGGTASVESAPGAGATFTVMTPIILPPPSPAALG